MSALRSLSALFVVVLAIGSGCASAPTDAEIRQAQIGESPTPQEACDSVNAYFHERLLDFDSAHIEVGELFRGWYKEPFGPRWIGWCSNVRVNARNGFGGYTGWRPWLFIWKGGQLVKVTERPAQE